MKVPPCSFVYASFENTGYSFVSFRLLFEPHFHVLPNILTAGITDNTVVIDNIPPLPFT